MTDVRLVDEGAGMVRLSFRYDRDLIDIVKEASRGLREYDSSTKSWLVNESVIEQVIEAMIANGHQVISGDGPPPPKAPAYDADVDGFFAPTTDSDKAFVKAMVETISAQFDKMPPNSRHRVFRGVAKHLYPDLYDARK